MNKIYVCPCDRYVCTTLFECAAIQATVKYQTNLLVNYLTSVMMMTIKIQYICLGSVESAAIYVIEVYGMNI